jgi:hypothetical protein
MLEKTSFPSIIFSPSSSEKMVFFSFPTIDQCYYDRNVAKSHVIFYTNILLQEKPLDHYRAWLYF